MAKARIDLVLPVASMSPSPQNKELKSRLASSEGMQKAGGSISQLEARLEELQDRLQAEER